MDSWKDIQGYEGLYKININGDVMSIRSHKIMKPEITKDGYCRVKLTKNGIRKNYKVHRLVAFAFINNPNNLKFVNHKDENKLNNNVNNLEWCTAKYNCNYGTRNARMAKANSGRHLSEDQKKLISERNKKKVYQLTKDGILVKIWDSAISVTRELGICNSGIYECCNGKIDTHKGYVWRYSL